MGRGLVGRRLGSCLLAICTGLRLGLLGGGCRLVLLIFSSLGHCQMMLAKN